ncbi:L-aspartate oxidase [Propionibacteriaceae bacterium Y1700]|uniref:L-aspartate oxidase n=1 Tax=Microlunatus sp. Y1700 TaxID=3418487 RepID=UPI003DA6F248
MIPDDLPQLVRRLPATSASWAEAAEVVIIGAGAAGLMAAIPLLEAGRRVTMITKADLGDGSTAWAQGGLAAVLDRGDSLTAHADDTATAGAGLCQPGPVEELVTAAPEAIRRLVSLGANFDRSTGGSYALGLEGGHHRRRIVHAGGDASGAEVARTLVEAVRQRSATLTIHDQSVVTDLLVDSGTVIGVRMINTAGQVGEILAPAVVLATGGIGQAWEDTTNPATATGDGLALALRAGAILRDVEFVQFHPTVLAVPEQYRRPGGRGVLVSEAVRGEGARLVDRDGRPIMAGLHPQGDLAPRDVVASAIHAHLMASGDDHVLLDGTDFGPAVWQQHFPSILKLCRDHGVDPISAPIPVRPAEHYACGGVLATMDGQTSLPGLYAVGEVASTGVQGANRLASNSLTEAVIAGERVGHRLLAAPYHDAPSLPRPPHDPAVPTGVITADARTDIVAAISRGAGVLRDEHGLTLLLKTLGGLEPASDPVGHLSSADVEATNLHTVGILVAAAALQRQESRGCHRRADFPHTATNRPHHSLLGLGADSLQVWTTTKESR